jgi:hypothetical protein
MKHKGKGKGKSPKKLGRTISRAVLIALLYPGLSYSGGSYYDDPPPPPPPPEININDDSGDKHGGCRKNIVTALLCIGAVGIGINYAWGAGKSKSEVKFTVEGER